jgi:hypothetical protein
MAKGKFFTWETKPYRVQFANKPHHDVAKVVRVEKVLNVWHKPMWQVTYRKGFETPSAFLIGETKTKKEAMQIANNYMRGK